MELAVEAELDMCDLAAAQEQEMEVLVWLGLHDTPQADTGSWHRAGQGSHCGPWSGVLGSGAGPEEEEV